MAQLIAPYRVVVRSSRVGRITVDSVELQPKGTLERALADRKAQLDNLARQGFVAGGDGKLWLGNEWAKVVVRNALGDELEVCDAQE